MQQPSHTGGSMKELTKLIMVSDSCPTNLAQRAWHIDMFVLLKKLGSGYASTVYLGACRTTGVQVAIKLYHKSKLSELNYFQISREIRIHGQLDHHNIVQLWAAFEDVHGIYLVSEYAQKGDVFSDVEKRGGSLTEVDAVNIVIHPFLQALQYLHGNNVIHRDIKPENLLLTATGVLKVADFGLSINTSEERPVTRVGTLDYMSPEVVICPDKHKPQDNKDMVHLQYTPVVDAWAVGVLAYELCVGKPPFDKGNKKATIQEILQGTPSVPAHISEQAAHFMGWALTKHPAHRPSVAQLLEHPWVMQNVAQPKSRHMVMRADSFVDSRSFMQHSGAQDGRVPQAMEEIVRSMQTQAPHTNGRMLHHSVSMSATDNMRYRDVRLDLLQALYSNSGSQAEAGGIEGMQPRLQQQVVPYIPPCPPSGPHRLSDSLQQASLSSGNNFLTTTPPDILCASPAASHGLATVNTAPNVLTSSMRLAAPPKPTSSVGGASHGSAAAGPATPQSAGERLGPRSLQLLSELSHSVPGTRVPAPPVGFVRMHSSNLNTVGPSLSSVTSHRASGISKTVSFRLPAGGSPVTPDAGPRQAPQQGALQATSPGLQAPDKHRSPLMRSRTFVQADTSQSPTRAAMQAMLVQQQGAVVSIQPSPGLQRSAGSVLKLPNQNTSRFAQQQLQLGGVQGQPGQPMSAADLQVELLRLRAAAEPSAAHVAAPLALQQGHATAQQAAYLQPSHNHQQRQQQLQENAYQLQTSPLSEAVLMSPSPPPYGVLGLSQSFTCGSLSAPRAAAAAVVAQQDGWKPSAQYTLYVGGSSNGSTATAPQHSPRQAGTSTPTRHPQQQQGQYASRQSSAAPASMQPPAQSMVTAALAAAGPAMLASPGTGRPGSGRLQPTRLAVSQVPGAIAAQFSTTVPSVHPVLGMPMALPPGSTAGQAARVRFQASQGSQTHSTSGSPTISSSGAGAAGQTMLGAQLLDAGMTALLAAQQGSSYGSNSYMSTKSTKSGGLSGSLALDLMDVDSTVTDTQERSSLLASAKGVLRKVFSNGP